MTTTERRSWVEQIMGLPISVLVRGPEVRTRPEVAAAVADVFASLRGADAGFSTYRDDSRLLRWWRGESEADAELREVLALCEQARVRTGGLFDAHPPGRALDPSGLVKGWAVERAVAALQGPAELDWVVGAGGDVLGRARHGAPWRVGIEDPRDRRRVLATVEVTEGAVATSGAAARGPHVIDPRTGEPARGLASATVTGPGLMWADVLATAAYVAGPMGYSLPQGYQSLLVEPDGTLTASAGWPGKTVG